MVRLYLVGLRLLGGIEPYISVLYFLFLFSVPTLISGIDTGVGSHAARSTPPDPAA